MNRKTKIITIVKWYKTLLRHEVAKNVGAYLFSLAESEPDRLLNRSMDLKVQQQVIIELIIFHAIGLQSVHPKKGEQDVIFGHKKERSEQ